MVWFCLDKFNIKDKDNPNTDRNTLPAECHITIQTRTVPNKNDNLFILGQEINPIIIITS